MERVEVTGRVAVNRSAIRNAAYRLVIADGYAATTIDAIAREAGVSRRTFFNHFPTKESVVLPEPLRISPQVARQFELSSGPLIDDVAVVVRDSLADSATGMTADIGRALGGAMAENPALFAAFLSAHNAFETEVIAVVRQRLDAAGVEAGQAQREAYLAGLIATALLRSQWDTWIGPGIPDPLAAAADLRSVLSR